MQLVIHCGAHKTGTTSIQALLSEQRQELLKQGVLYIPEAQLNRSGIIEYLHRPNACASVRSAIRSEIGKVLEKAQAEKVLVSHESFFSFVSIFQGSGNFYRATGQSLKNLELLELNEIFSSFRVVLYVRRQDEFLQSLYMQNLSSGIWTNSFKQAMTKIDCSNISWLSYATKLANFFGESNVVVRPFEVVNSGWQKLINDFCMASTINLGNDLGEKKINESFSTPAYLAALALMPLFNKGNSKLQLAQTLKRVFPPSVFGKANLLPEAVKLGILGQLENDNRELFATFIRDYPADFYAPTRPEN